MVRTVLSLHVPSVSPETWQFRRSDFGQPLISFPKECSDWRFSLSHCRGLAACLIARGTEVGVDVEPVDRSADMEAIARQFFHSDEVEMLRRTPAADRQTAFIRLWTLKEAYLKARGTGLSTPLSHCAFDVRNPDRIRVAFHGDLGDVSDHWLFRLTMLDKSHIMALAVKSGEEKLDIHVRTNMIVP